MNFNKNTNKKVGKHNCAMLNMESKTYEEIMESFMVYYRNKYGQEKIKTIYEKVMTSDKISGLISKARFRGFPPGSQDYVLVVSSIPYFMFASSQTLAMASLFSLSKWDGEANANNEYLNDSGMKLRAMNIINELKVSFW